MYAYIRTHIHIYTITHVHIHAPITNVCVYVCVLSASTTPTVRSQVLFIFLVLATNVLLFRRMIQRVDKLIKASFLPLTLLPNDLAFQLPKVKEVIAEISKTTLTHG